MNVVKTSSNVEFDVIYADGTKLRVKEGVLFGVEDECVIFHNGTSRLSVLFAAAEGAMEAIAALGHAKTYAKYLFDAPLHSPGRIALLQIMNIFDRLL